MGVMLNRCTTGKTLDVLFETDNGILALEPDKRAVKGIELTVSEQDEEEDEEDNTEVLDDRII